MVDSFNGELCNYFAHYCKMITQSTIKLIHHSSFSDCVTTFTQAFNQYDNREALWNRMPVVTVAVCRHLGGQLAMASTLVVMIVLPLFLLFFIRFFSVVPYSHRLAVQIKIKSNQKLFKVPSIRRQTLFQTPSAILEPNRGHF